MLTTAQVAAGFGVTVQAVSHWVLTGKIVPSQKANLRGDYRFSREVVDEFARKNGLIFQDPQQSNESN